MLLGVGYGVDTCMGPYVGFLVFMVLKSDTSAKHRILYFLLMYSTAKNIVYNNQVISICNVYDIKSRR